MNATEQKSALKVEYDIGMFLYGKELVPSYHLFFKNNIDDTVLATRLYFISPKSVEMAERLSEDKNAMDIIKNAIEASLEVDADASTLEKYFCEKHVVDKKGKTLAKKKINCEKAQKEINTYLGHCSKHIQRSIWIALNVENKPSRWETLVKKAKRFLYGMNFQSQINF